MIDTRELQKKIQTGEDSFLELKELHLSGNSVTGPHRNGMADELAAMANSNSGIIILGVNDKTREITGIPDQALDFVETWVREIVNDLVEPPILCQISKIQLDTRPANATSLQFRCRAVFSFTEALVAICIVSVVPAGR